MYQVNGNPLKPRSFRQQKFGASQNLCICLSNLSSQPCLSLAIKISLKSPKHTQGRLNQPLKDLRIDQVFSRLAVSGSPQKPVNHQASSTPWSIIASMCPQYLLAKTQLNHRPYFACQLMNLLILMLWYFYTPSYSSVREKRDQSSSKLAMGEE